MKKTFVFIVCSLFAFMATAQSIDGLELGSYYSKDQAHVALSRAVESTADNGMLMFTSGESRFYFDFTGAFESNDGRFASADVCDAGHIVKFTFGEFRVGDHLSRLVYLRANLQMLGVANSTCVVSYVKGTRRTSAVVKFDSNFNILEVCDFSSDKVKKAENVDRGPFYASVPSVKVGNAVLNAGDPVSRVLSLGVDVDFTGLQNGICKITTGGWKPASYLVRYDMNHIIKEILPL